MMLDEIELPPLTDQHPPLVVTTVPERAKHNLTQLLS